MAPSKRSSSHTSRSTRAFLDQMEQNTGIHYVPFTDIPVKAPDASTMDFCAFGLLKRAFGNRRPRTLNGLCWKACQEGWEKIDMYSAFQSHAMETTMQGNSCHAGVPNRAQ